ncbi:SCF E3 ubiquitin ligase complex F-box protein grrA [Cordyceps javanica]|uniref:SCF E3 ubiquitin ligase complex F-box protein grrA n=1 Tax=Cordyceps javanica TaxID=43265 RepID=A0A545ULH3_9HYPO|nr:SCF E3 ubiquitin ligase complex F-box protein grrA [Cordyceps javanica]TQW01771.1 SCF E3 ubiquitin ligase complex F-box protein grrA [Cordyceps javanica]
MVHTKAIARVPDEIFVMIFSLLRKPDLRTLMLVCKQWAKNTVGLLWSYAQVKDGDLVWRTLATPKPFFDYRSMVEVVRLDSNMTDDEVLPHKFRIKDLLLIDCRLTETGFAALLQDPTSLSTLTIVSDKNENTGVCIRTIANRCTALQSLRISFCEASLQSLSTLSKSCESLKNVTFQDCPQLLDEDILALTENCKNTVEFKLLCVDVCKLVDHVAFLGLPDKELKHLNFLSLSHSSLTDAAIPHIIRAAPMIQVLNLQYCRITNAALPAISRLKNLESLYVYDAEITKAEIQVLMACTAIRETHHNGSIATRLPGLSR